MFLENLNYIVIVIAGLVGIGIGIVWHSPYVFGKLWLSSMGWSVEHMKAKKEGKPMAPIYVAMTLGSLVTAFILAGLFNSLVIVGFWNIVFTGFCVWLGFSVPVKLADYLFGGDSFVFFLISIGYHLVTIVTMSVLIGIFG